MADLDPRIAGFRGLIDARLAELVPGETTPPETLHRAVRHSLLAPGKRYRPLMVLIAAEAFGGDPARALDPACAIEMVHTASLILDDLPFMDDAERRRGRPACHHVFGQDIASLASIGLLNRAFAVLAEAPGLGDSLRLDLVRLLSRMIGDDGIVAGQVRDLRHAGGQDPDAAELEQAAREKTGALFLAALETGARIGGASAGQLEIVRVFAWNLGLCFQVLDDLVDRHGCEIQLGKDVGQDKHRATFVDLLGHEGAFERAEQLAGAARARARELGPAGESLADVARLFLDTASARLRVDHL